EAAKSGHPGAPMGCAPMAHCLFGHVMKASPKNPNWIARDRFVLSNGHGCALHYTMLHLMGYKVSLEDLKKFRQVDEKCPGHPENHSTPGIEVTTGPLGQGVAQAVGLAIAAESVAARYNKPDVTLFDSFIYTIVGDGCLQEGVASEACSLAGHLKLGRLIVFYDKNGISIDGDTDLSFTEDVAMRFQSYGFQVLHVADGDSDVDGMLYAIETAKKNSSQPSLIICNTTIGFGSKKEGTEKVHGSPLGAEDLKQLREKFGLPSDDMFQIPAEVLDFYRRKGQSGDQLCSEWESLLTIYGTKYPAEHAELLDRINGTLPKGWMDCLPKYTPESKADSTRALSGSVLNAVVSAVPSVMGGSADLTGSNCTGLKTETAFQANNRRGRYLHFGVREHGMAAICNGIFAFGGFRSFGATFLNFVTYAWGAVRLSALSRFGILYVATHDSIELGEDGPTHQPIEVAALCRATPNMIYYRPADGSETSAGYAVWLTHQETPTVMALCRGAVPQLQGSSVEGAMKGAYVLEDFADNGKPKCLLGGCGSELHLCVQAAKALRSDYDVRVVSMPSWDLFLGQPEEYQRSVLPQNVKSVYVEAANTLGCERFFTTSIGMQTFGASGPKNVLWNKFGFTASNIEKTARSLF
ncbi:uncharacterized protein LOC129618108, partial [Condylostylus longicornis]|uniref:uncharacterized protein LOC129618108 n=1 Tax=Condylostylus longicornis TaxID=2530218 RepID=UPI00244DBCC7